MYSIGVDLGGTNIAVGLVTEAGEILYKDSCPTGVRKPSRRSCGIWAS